MNTEKIKKQILLFQSKDKFADEEWEKRGLNPSVNEMSVELNLLFNNIAEDLLQSLEKESSKKKLLRVLKNGLKRFRKSKYDTEEKAFICDYFFELSEIVNVDFKDNLNKWMYGSALVTFLKIASYLKKK